VSDKPAARKPRAKRSWYQRKRPIFRFVGLFAFFMGLFYVCEITPFFVDQVFPRYLRLNARASAAILNVLDEGTRVTGTSISSPRFSVDIRHGCDALLPSALFVSAVLASPVPLLSKIPGVLAGTLFLLLMNLVRIVTLFYSGVYIPRYFERMHLEVWPAIFILVSLTLWVIWARWARDLPDRKRHETG
jgi:exosortase/archaeosortase family protein